MFPVNELNYHAFAIAYVRPDGSLYHASTSQAFKSIPASLQMPITFPSRFLSEPSLEIPDISTLFLLLYYSITTCCFSSSVTRVTGRVLVLKTTISLSEIRQKSESQNGCFKKTQHAKFSEKQTFLTP